MNSFSWWKNVWYNRLSLTNKVYFWLSIIGIVLSIAYSGYLLQNTAIGSGNQQIIGDNNIQAGGDVIVVNTFNLSQLCSDSKVNTTLSEIGLVNHFTFTVNKSGVPTTITPNFFNIKFTLPTGQEVFIDKFLVNQSIVFGLCGNNHSNCYIFPDYRYDNATDYVCIDAVLDRGWGDAGFTMKETVNRSSCIQDASNNNYLIECTAV